MTIDMHDVWYQYEEDPPGSFQVRGLITSPCDCDRCAPHVYDRVSYAACIALALSTDHAGRFVE